MTPLPDSWVFDSAVLVLGVYRLARLIGWDQWPPIAALRDRVLGTTVDRLMTQRTETKVLRYRRSTLADAIFCPFCAGFWIGLVAYACWLVVPDATVYVLAPFALSSLVGIIGRNLDP